MQVTAQHYQLPIIYFQMDSELIPEEMTAIPMKPRLVPFYPVKTSLPKSAGGYYRSQLPLAPFHVSTVHRCQGMTAKSPGGVVYDPPTGSPFTMGLDYIALSRCQQQQDLVLLGPLQLNGFISHSAIRRQIKDKYTRLKAL
jgi:hypothetical protein